MGVEGEDPLPPTDRQTGSAHKIKRRRSSSLVSVFFSFFLVCTPFHPPSLFKFVFLSISLSLSLRLSLSASRLVFFSSGEETDSIPLSCGLLAVCTDVVVCVVCLMLTVFLAFTPHCCTESSEDKACQPDFKLRFRGGLLRKETVCFSSSHTALF